jgi:UDP-galactopyranose mutase
MKLVPFFVAGALALGSYSGAQAPSKNVQDANQVLVNIDKLNVVKFVLPLLLKKKQIGAMMAAMEKCRSKELEVRESDAKELLKLDADVKKAVSGAVEKGDYPDKALQAKVIAVQEAIITRRKIVVNENVQILEDAAKLSLDEGQLKVMVNILDPRSVDPSAKPDKMSDEEKRRFYLRAVFLDGLTYELLKVMYKKAE